MKFIDYIHGSRKGKDAHRIEKDAMDDPFLAEAIEGYDSIRGNHADRIARMQSAITARSSHRRTTGAWKVAVAAVGLIVIASGYFMLMNHQSSMLTAHESNNGYIDLYVPEDYVEQKRLELTAIQEENPKKEITATSVANISNLHDVIAPIEPLRVYLPGNYAQQHQKEARETTFRQDNRNIIETEEVISSDVPLLAEHHQADEKVTQSEYADSTADNNPDENIGNTTLYFSQNAVVTTRSKISAKEAKSNKSTSKRITLEGKIVDNNNEPLIGVSVVEKGTTNGTITDIDGNYKLNVDSENTPLTASYIGFENVDIPNPKDTKIVAMTENNNTLAETVVVGYGAQKKASITSSVSDVKSNELAKNKIEKIKPQPVTGYKEYNKYLEQNLIRPQNTDCKSTKGKVILEFSVGIDGHPTNITVKRSLCPPLDQEAIRLLKGGPKWTSGNTKAEVEVKF